MAKRLFRSVVYLLFMCLLLLLLPAGKNIFFKRLPKAHFIHSQSPILTAKHSTPLPKVKIYLVQVFVICVTGITLFRQVCM
jgi:hypothetical protein